MTKALLIPLLLVINSAYAQTYSDLKQGDTLKYTPQSKKPGWISVQSGDANLAVSMSVDGKKAKEQDDSRGIKSVERLYFTPEKGKKYELKIWAKSYVEKSKTAKVSITESGSLPVLSDKLSSDELLEDLHVFRTIREQANSGLFVYRTKKQIDSIYNWAEAEVKNTTNLFNFYKVIAKLTDFEGSCHNFTHLPNDASYYLPQKLEYLPITLKNIDGRLLQNSKNVAIPLGAEILSVNDIPAREIISRFSQYYFSDGFSRPYKETAGFEKGMLDKFYIEFGTHKNYIITYQINNQKHQVTLPGISFENSKKLQESRYSVASKKVFSEKYSLDKVGEGMYRLTIRSFDFATGTEDPAYKKFSDFLDHMIQTLDEEKIQHLIIDLRGNPGGTGELYEKVFTYLTQRPFRDSHYAYSKFNVVPMAERLVITPLFLSNGVTDKNGLNAYLKEQYPKEAQGKFYWADDKNSLILPNNKTFKGQLYLFADENVASAGSHLASLIKSYTNAIVIGKETVGGYYEHNGHFPVVYELPNTRIQTGFSIVHVIQDAQQLSDQKRGQGIIPNIKIQQTDQEFLDQTDVYLKKLAEIRKEKS
ncbi:S41 family peptidase [Chryseobacterium lactis]|nr:S41 family peptidase [Chryseobacterium lactis]